MSWWPSILSWKSWNTLKIHLAKILQLQNNRSIKRKSSWRMFWVLSEESSVKYKWEKTHRSSEQHVRKQADPSWPLEPVKLILKDLSSHLGSGGTRGTGTPCFTVLRFIALHTCCVCTNGGPDPPPAKRWRLAVLRCSFYCGDLELTPQCLWCMPVPLKANVGTRRSYWQPAKVVQNL